MQKCGVDTTVLETKPYKLRQYIFINTKKKGGRRPLLQFLHIITVARGGINTSRNIQQQVYRGFAVFIYNWVQRVRNKMSSD